MTKPRVSVIIPSYNKSDYIAETLDSLINQECDDWEAIVVEDGSTDNSMEIIEKYAKKDQRIRFYLRNREPKGGSVCRNIGVEKSSADYIIFLDADDLLAPHAIKERAKLMSANKEMDFLVFPRGIFYHQVGDCNIVLTPKEDEDHLVQFLSYQMPWQTSTPIWKKSFLYHIGLFDEKYPRLQDVELHARALFDENVQYKIFDNDHLDFYYRVDLSRKVSDSPQKAEMVLKGFELFTTNMYDIVKSKQDKERYIKALKNVFYSAMFFVSREDFTIQEKIRLHNKITEFETFDTILNHMDKMKYYYLLFRSSLRIRSKVYGIIQKIANTFSSQNRSV